MGLSINDLKSGITILLDGQAWMIIEAHHIKPGKGAAFTRAKIRNMKNASVLERTFRGDEKIEEAYVEERKLQYQYVSADMYHFMDQETYEDIAISKDVLSEQAKFLKDNLDATAYFYKDEVLNVALPNFIEFEIIHTEPGIKGDTAKSSFKPATIETNAVIQVPLFLNTGDRIKIDTRTGQYVERVN